MSRKNYDFTSESVSEGHPDKVSDRISVAHARKHEGATQLGPDSKSQVTISYENGKPARAKAIVLSTQHLDASMESADVAALVKPYIHEVLPDGWITDDTVWHINPTGKFVIGGPDGDAGLTGRKIIVDTYGGMARAEPDVDLCECR